MKEYLKGGRSVVRDKALAIELGVYCSVEESLACAVGPLPSSSQVIAVSACASRPLPPPLPLPLPLPRALTTPAAGSVVDDMDDKIDVDAGIDVEVDPNENADRQGWRPSSS